MNLLWTLIFSPDFLYSIIRVTTPILLAALGALVSSKAGVANIGLEGIMLFSALSGVIASAYTGSALIGLIAAVLTGMLLASVLAYFTLKLKTNVILGGIAINFFADGGSVFVLNMLTGEKGTSSSLPSKVLPTVHIPFIEDIPVIGQIISGHNIITYVAVGCAIFVYVMLKSTSFGMKVRAAGENDKAAQSVGIDVLKVRFKVLVLSGVFCGFAGAFLSMGYVSWFSRGMSAGRGWIGLAAEAVGKGTPVGTVLASLLFGFAESLANTLQFMNMPSELVGTLPYVFTVIGLFAYSIRRTGQLKKLKRSAYEENHN